ncbi:MAG TPA: right-handed parallel beta-helix repeat-containing protein, partial [Spirochaetota bacterium]|nr:right-handed parallel beta-helix repeat-containing protein [Spirochaetota bacterium]
MKKIYIIFIIFISTYLSAAAYYLSSSGSDTNSGLTPAAAWQSISRLNSYTITPGDHIYFNSSNTFSGTIMVTAAEGSTQTTPVVFTSYGPGKAVIDSSGQSGFYAEAAAGIIISNLVFRGSGQGISSNDGLVFYHTSTTGKKDNFLFLTGLQISGYYNGISIGSSHASFPGYSNVFISNSTVYSCTKTGILSYAHYDLSSNYAVNNMYIGFCDVFDICGDSNLTSTHSGSGIVMAGVSNGLIEYCTAYSNGRYNAWPNGGPIGIWAWHSRDIIIRYNISRHNSGGLTGKDGGGFDLDGGVSHSCMQYNYSYENEGAGYLIAQFKDARHFYSNTVCYNISQNDGLKNAYGGIVLWAAASSSGIRDCFIY